MTMTTAISVNHVWKSFRLYHERNQYLKAAALRGRRARYEEFWALQDISFEVQAGESFGVVGSNGSGKSTLLKILSGVLVADKGSIARHGRLSSLLELGAGFHPELSGRENIYLNGAVLGLKRKEINALLTNIVEFAELEKFIDLPVKNYSNGMYIRLGFSVAVHVDPEILILDEVLAVGDESFQKKSRQRIERFKEEGRTILFVSHDLESVAGLCDSAIWILEGKVKSSGPAREVVDRYSVYETSILSSTSDEEHSDDESAESC